MIYAFATDDCSLNVFDSEKDAISYCEGFDVSQGNWVFFGNDGGSLEVHFDTQASQVGIFVSNGSYYLRRADNASPSDLIRLLPRIASVESQGCPSSVAEVKRLLTIASNAKAQL
ncbi:hypothetical protein [Limnobacter sp. P1]|uniref:hypothetical protein n=1 Tax=Limnobacter olei TaxID=3031298 RepID=UPI0023B0A6E5|nr:hypothetical protein [Limnobacter sp. P1]